MGSAPAMLHDDRDARISGYSKGMRQKILIAAALLHNPNLIVLDEPFSGLDVASALTLSSLIQELAARGKVVLFSSHEFDTVERVSILAVSFAPLEMQALSEPVRYAILCIGLGGAAGALWALNSRRARSAVLYLEELRDQLITTLGLSSPPAMTKPGQRPIAP